MIFDGQRHKHVTVFAYNLKGYDGHFLLRYMIANGISFNPIYQGSKIMTVHIYSNLNMRLVDTLNFFPKALAKLPEAFGFSGGKGDFPHFFNLPENQEYVGPYPEPACYGADTKSPTERR